MLLFIKTVKNAICVSDYIYSDALTFEASTETYRAGLAELDKMLARECDTVIEVCAGNVILHKGVLKKNKRIPRIRKHRLYRMRLHED